MMTAEDDTHVVSESQWIGRSTQHAECNDDDDRTGQYIFTIPIVFDSNLITQIGQKRAELSSLGVRVMY